MKTSKLSMVVSAIILCASASSAFAGDGQQQLDTQLNITGSVKAPACVIETPDTVSLGAVDFITLSNAATDSIVNSADTTIRISGCNAGQEMSLLVAGMSPDGDNTLFENKTSNADNGAGGVAVMITTATGDAFQPVGGLPVSGAAPTFTSDANGIITIPLKVGYAKPAGTTVVTPGIVTTQASITLNPM